MAEFIESPGAVPVEASPPPATEAAPLAAQPGSVEASLIAQVQQLTAPQAPPAVAAAEAPAAPAASTTEAPAVTAPDFAPFLKELGVGSVDDVRAALATAKEADTLRANQRTPADLAVMELFSDPAKLSAFAAEQARDYAAEAQTDPRAVLQADFRRTHPNLSPEQADVLFNYEFKQQLPDYEFAVEDPDNPEYAEVLNVARVKASAVAPANTAHQKEQRTALETAATERASAQTAAQQAEAALLQQWDAGVTKFMETAPDVLKLPVGEGIAVDFALTPEQKAAVQAMMIDTAGGIYDLCKTADGKGVDEGKLFQRAVFARYPEAALAQAYAAGQKSQPASLPFREINNPAPAAAPAAVGAPAFASKDEAYAAQARAQMAKG